MRCFESTFDQLAETIRPCLQACAVPPVYLRRQTATRSAIQSEPCPVLSQLLVLYQGGATALDMQQSYVA